MTIAVAIRTGSAVVFAADSKVTTNGLAGFEQDGQPRWVEQTYDSATKVVHDARQALMAMIAGHAALGQVPASDVISTRLFPAGWSFSKAEDQDQAIRGLVDDLAIRKRDYWSTTQVPADQWPGPTMLLATLSPGGGPPRTWRVELSGESFSIEEILTEPGIRLEGSYYEVFGLLYGYEPTVMEGVCAHLGATFDRVQDAMLQLRILRPYDKLNLWGMPVQDAMDLAYFLATVQVQMDRFLPGPARCGGPIDVMVIQTAPAPGIQTFPGKALHHPGRDR